MRAAVKWALLGRKILLLTGTEPWSLGQSLRNLGTIRGLTELRRHFQIKWPLRFSLRLLLLLHFFLSVCLSFFLLSFFLPLFLCFIFLSFFLSSFLFSFVLSSSLFLSFFYLSFFYLFLSFIFLSSSLPFLFLSFSLFSFFLSFFLPFFFIFYLSFFLSSFLPFFFLSVFLSFFFPFFLPSIHLFSFIISLPRTRSTESSTPTSLDVCSRHTFPSSTSLQVVVSVVSRQTNSAQAMISAPLHTHDL